MAQPSSLSSACSTFGRNRTGSPILVAIFLAIFAFLISLPAQEPGSRLRIVFELSSGDEDSLQALAADVEGLQENAGNLADITVVAFGAGVRLLRTGNEEVEKQLADLADNGVDFAVCGTSLEEAEISRDNILSFARTVKLGTKEVEQLEEQGWARIPEGESYVTHP